MDDDRQAKRQCLDEKSRIFQLREEEIETWKGFENAADQMVPIVGQLYRVNNVICTVFGKGLVHKSSIDIIKLHSFVCKHMGYQLTPHNTLTILHAIQLMNNPPTGIRIDLGRTFWLVRKFIQNTDENTVASVLSPHLKQLIDDQTTECTADCHRRS